MRSIPIPLGRALLACAGLCAVAASSAAVVFADGTMDMAGFSATPLYATPGVTVVSSQTNLLGNPSSALQVLTGTLSGQTDYIYNAGFMYGAFVFDPTVSGAAVSLDVSIDRAVDFRRNGNPVAGVGLTARPLILQGGNYYMAISAAFPVTGLPAFDTLTMAGVVAQDFGLFDFATGAHDMSQNPDFAGSSMQFGFAVRALFTGVGATEQIVLDAYADNFRLQVNQTVSEPGAAALVMLAIVALAGARRRPART